MPGTLADQLAEFARSTTFEGLPQQVVAEAWRRLLDTLACAAGAINEFVPQAARRIAGRIHGDPSVALIGGGYSAPEWAAFANGVHIRYLDCNDTYLALEPAHPSDNWAAVMAAGEAAGADGRDWIAAAAIAYEVQCRLCDAASLRARGWDHTTFGSISTVLAAARLFGLSHEQTVHALGIAGTTGAALRVTRVGELSMWKGCAFAFAARNGVFAAQIAAEGITGPSPVFEGEMGFCEQVSGRLELPSLGGPTAEDWMLPKTLVKFVPAEYHSQSAIAAALELRKEIGDPGRIRSVEIATIRSAVEIIGKDPEKWHPRTRETADHSLPYCTAVALVDGEISAAQFTPQRLSDPALLELVSRTTVVEDPRLTASYPEFVPNRVRVTLDDGSELVREVSYPPGHCKCPLTDEQMVAKFHGLVDPVLGQSIANEIRHRTSNLECDPAPHEIVALLRAEPHPARIAE
jgi:2-methylcitrate dehydratase